MKTSSTIWTFPVLAIGFQDCFPPWLAVSYLAIGFLTSCQLGRKSKHHKGLASRKIWSVEELETLHASTEPRKSHHIDRLEEIGVERWKRSTILLDRTTKGHRQSDQHWNFFKYNTGKKKEKTPRRRAGAHTSFLERLDTILNWTELNSTAQGSQHDPWLGMPETDLRMFPRSSSVGLWNEWPVWLVIITERVQKLY